MLDATDPFLSARRIAAIAFVELRRGHYAQLAPRPHRGLAFLAELTLAITGPCRLEPDRSRQTQHRPRRR